MDLDTVNLLKEKGNKAYVDGKYDEALDFYQKALDSVGSEDTNIAAILHSNIAQIYLQKKNYSHVIESATESLKLDPSFKKSNLRRASANVELNNLSDAMDDLRLIFSNEPKNKAAKDLMKRCSDLPKMKRELHEIYVKHYLRPILKKLGAHDVGPRTGVCPIWFRNAVLRQSFLSMGGLNIGNYFLCEAFAGFQPFQTVLITFHGWISRKFMWFGYSHSSIAVLLSDNLFDLLYQLLRSGTFLLIIIGSFPLCDKTLLLNKYSDVFLVKEPVLHLMPVDENDLKMMDHHSNDMTRLVYTSRLADLKKTQFPKAKTLTFDGKLPITSEFLKLWKKNEWPIESLLFVHGVPDLQVLKQFNEIVSSKVKNVFLQWPEQNQKFNKITYNKLCGNLAVLKNAFSDFNEVTIIHKYALEVQYFPTFVQDMAFIREAYETISTKPEWCPKLKVVIVVEFLANSRTESKIFDAKLLEQRVKSLRQKHPDMQIRLCGPRSYDGFWGPSIAVHAVVEFENKVAQFELAICYDYPLK